MDKEKTGERMMSIKTIIIKVKWFPSACFNKLVMKIRKIQVGAAVTTYGSMFIRGTGKIEIGNHVSITSCRETNPIGGDDKTILFAKGKDSQIVIGDYTGISNTAIVAMSSIVIEDHVLIGGDCKIYDHDFHSLRFSERMQFPDPGVQCKPVLIKSGAFIGAHSIILKGVTIGKKKYCWCRIRCYQRCSGL